MITLTDFYHVMTAMVPLYVAMILAYGSVKWWKIFTPDQCSGINRFVALFAVPLLSFHFISTNNPYAMNFRFIAADTLQKVIVLVILALWTKLSKRGCLVWTITLFSLSTLPNTLVMGIPLLKGIGAKMLISEQFPDTAGSIVSIHVDSDIMSLDGRQPLETEAEIKEDDVYGLSASRGPTPRSSNYEEDAGGLGNKPRFHYHASGGANHYPAPNPGMFSPTGSKGGVAANNAAVTKKPNGQAQQKAEDGGGRDLHMFVWSSSASPVSDVFGSHDYGAHDQKEVRVAVSPGKVEVHRENHHHQQEDYMEREDFSFGNRGLEREMNNNHQGEKVVGDGGKPKAMPPTSVMTRLILIMVWRKLIRNPNTYSSLIGLIWSLVSFRWHVEMPAIIAKSISILSDAGLGMAMFSLGLFMALQPRIIACGNSIAAFAMAVRFLTGPAVMAAASIAVGLRGTLLHVAIVQAALPQGIVPFVFAKEYNVHPDILSTGVIFGMLIALPITLVYYILLGL
ncbi:hypothetical protein GH714_022677 [Hevea brasiliensis]|uniref:Auxin efflux carrier component n=1 Tax=Hevea brasiliensis TaxID=3981 RepID=A0A6A6MVB6_HEVBR|nr:hypothetical protein GH714_022677 [Hevea brasiliensis]